MAHERLALLLTLVLAVSATCPSCGDNLTPLPSSQPYGEPTPAELACVPNLDGRIDSNELQPAVGVPVRYRVNPANQTRPVNLLGEVDANGKRIWRWDSDVSLDSEWSVAATSADEYWFADLFPSGAVAVPADPTGDTMGIYRHDTEAFWLLGVASTEEQPDQGQTLLIYESPVELYRFPLEVGKTWTSKGQVKNAKLLGLPYAATDTYTLSVEASGEMQLPDFTFQQVLLVTATVLIQPAVGTPLRQQQAYFLFECFGEVARATAAVGDESEPFTTAIDMRRLAL